MDGYTTRRPAFACSVYGCPFVSDDADETCAHEHLSPELHDEFLVRNDAAPCEGHADGPQMGVTAYCDGSCRRG